MTSTTTLPAQTLASVREQATRTARETAEEFVTDISDGVALAELLTGMQEGDPEHLDRIPGPSAEDASELSEGIDIDGEPLTPEQADAVSEVYCETFAEVVQAEVERRTIAALGESECPASVNVDGTHVETCADDGELPSRIDIDLNSDGYHSSALALGWVNSAAIHLDPSEDSVTVSISTGDPRGAFTMTIRRVPADAEHENAGRLVMHVPYPGMGFAHDTLTPLAEGTYRIGDAR